MILVFYNDILDYSWARKRPASSFVSLFYMQVRRYDLGVESHLHSRRRSSSLLPQAYICYIRAYNCRTNRKKAFYQSQNPWHSSFSTPHDTTNLAVFFFLLGSWDDDLAPITIPFSTLNFMPCSPQAPVT
ncbi:hypothetical protein NW756_001423 [Fusarium oxysporum]|nr:hypothetical protein NW756_001423 [Fusarium oxysporum]